MMKICIRRWLKAPPSAIESPRQPYVFPIAERRWSARPIALLVGGAVICGSLAVTAAWNTANAQAAGVDSGASRVSGPAGSSLSIGAQGRRKAGRQYTGFKGLDRADQNLRQNPIAGKARNRYNRAAVRYIRGSGYVSRPLRQAYKNLGAERRDVRRASARLARSPSRQAYQGLQRQYGQLAAARGRFQAATGRFVYNHRAGALRGGGRGGGGRRGGR
jgi:hypothetical protein